VGQIQPVAGGFAALNVGGALHNRAPRIGYPAAYTSEPLAELSPPLTAVGFLRATAPYAPTIEIPNTSQESTIFGAFITLLGAPGEAFLTMPSDCAKQAARPPQAILRMDTWQAPGQFDQRSVPLPPVTGCEHLAASADLTIEPDRLEADSPTALGVLLTGSVAGLTDPNALGPSPIEDVVAELPPGVVVDPAVANGLAACTEAEVGLESDAPASCPDASKVGTVEVKTALLSNSLPGTLYLAAPGDGNPFGSLFAFYLVIEDPMTGVILKLPAKAVLDPRTGQVTVELDELPQLPIESLRLAFKGGPRTLLATPTTCGRYPVEGVATPSSAPESGPPLAVGDSLAVDAGPAGSPCAASPAQRPFAVRGVAGSGTRLAGSASPFELQITRPDGSQELESLAMTLPPGIGADLRGIPRCADARIEAAEAHTAAEEQASPSCSAASQVGTVLTGAGSGPDPFYIPGKLYLAGPYQGAPLSLVSITPALAGPFDLGTLVVRTTLEVDSLTAQITARTTLLPRFLRGVGLRLRDLRMSLDRPGLIRNPTSCQPAAVTIVARGDSGAVADLSSRFQVGDCEALAFKPKLRLGLTGGTRRNGYPALTATLTQAPGQANVSRVSVTLPHSELLAQEHIRTVCSRVQFAEHACPAGSIYGYAEAETPLLDQPLSGPVYLRASDNKLPDLVVALKGPPSRPIEVNLAGRVDSVNGGIRNSFDLLPDAQIGKLVLKMQGGRKGLLVNSRNLCARPFKATVRFVGQNNKRADQSPSIHSRCGKRIKNNRLPAQGHRTLRSKVRRDWRLGIF
jgi:hypothetical protein